MTFDDPATRVLGVPPGADFPAALARALLDWAEGRDPAELARVTIYVNTARMQRRLSQLLSASGARLLPAIRLVTAIARDPAARHIPPAADPLRRRLELEALVAGLIDTLPDAPPADSAFALADSLATLIDEMHGEGVDPASLSTLDLSDQSGHWERNRRFLDLTLGYLSATRDGPDPEERLRRATAALIAKWQETPPADPVIVAGSTGSRGTTLMLMEAVARLPRGCLILPGFDTDMDDTLWQTIADDPTAEDHPQFRFARLLDRLGLGPGDVARLPGAGAPDPARNRFLSLALRPAPVTDQWLTDGPRAGDPARATAGLSLIEAPSSRIEAQAIALAIRAALEAGRVTALVTPDRMLTRRVAAHLDRWGIMADDSAGRPLGLSPPGRLLRLVADIRGRRVASDRLLSLLKHPLTRSGGERGPHLLLTRRLELWVRRNGKAFPTADDLSEWADKHDDRRDWALWVATLIERLEVADTAPLAAHVADHVALAEFTCGDGAAGPGALWQKHAGRAARLAMETLAATADAGREMTPRDYADLAGHLLERDVRDPESARPDAMIWGTMEARVQGADLVILGGLNEGSWPAQPAADPWLNRRMRADLGLLLPERRIGLAAHDFQQAAAAPEVILSRAVRLDDAEPVPSRWLNRLTNLLAGLHATGGPDALAAMRARGARWTDMARAIDRPATRLPPAPRPAPRPPVEDRPRILPVTDISRLIRDPYAVYAKRILRLRRLDPLHPEPGAPLRGQVLHKVFERFMKTAEAEGLTPDRLIAVADATLAELVQWPVTRRLWQSRVARIAHWFVAQEATRDGTFLKGEVHGELLLPEAGFTLTARADRIDRLPGDGLAILDYKTGSAPTARQMRSFDKQLPLEALIGFGGGYEGIAAADIGWIAHISLGSDPKVSTHPLTDHVVKIRGDEIHLRFAPASIRADLLKLLAAWDRREQGYAARRAVEGDRFEGDYDHLARYGEWDDSTEATAEEVG